MEDYLKCVDDEEDEINIKELIHSFLRYWKIFVKWSLFGLVLGFVFAMGIPKVYSSQAVIVPETYKRSISGSISSLASLAGVNLNSMGGSSDAITFEAYPQIVKSNPFIYDLCNTEVEFKYKQKVVSTTVYDYIENFTKSSWWSYPFSLPGMLLSLFSNKENSENTFMDSLNFSKKQEKIANRLRRSIDIRVDKKTQMITITTTLQNPQVTAKVCETVISLLKKYVTKYRTEKTRNTQAYFEKIYKDVQKSYYDAQQQYAKYLDSNQDILKRSRQTEEERLKNEMEIRYNMYMTCAGELQNAKAAVQHETPVLAVINPASIPNKKTSPSKLMYGIGFAFLAFVAVAIWVIFVKDKIIEL